MTQFKVGDEVQFNEDVVREADRIDKANGGTRGYAEGIIEKGGLESGGVIERNDYADEAPFQIVLPGGRKCWAEEEWLKTLDKFQPGDVVNWVSEDGGQRANGVWDGSTIVKRCTTIAFKDYYQVTHPEKGVVGTIHQDELVLAEKPATKISDLMDKSFSMTFSVVPEVKDPDAPTVEELSQGIDITDYITDLTGFEPLPYQTKIVEELVDHPAHYGGEDDVYEVIKVIEAWGLGFHLGNAVKYIPRAGVKDPETEIQDLEKARWYVDRRIQWLKENEDA